MHPTDALAEAGRFLHSRGWVPATSGNLSVRDGDGWFVTVSGRHKGRLGRGDFLRVGPDGAVDPPSARPSAEAALHAGLYGSLAHCGAVLHTHSPHATVLGRCFPDGVVVDGHEIGKAFPGVTTHEHTLRIPVFPNDQDVPAMWRRADGALGEVPGFLIAGHGLYAWGATVDDALRHVEAFEHLFTCVVLEATLRSAR